MSTNYVYVFMEKYETYHYFWSRKVPNLLMILDQPKHRSEPKHRSIYLFTLQLLYNTVRYNLVLDITRFKDGSQKCIDYIEK